VAYKKSPRSFLKFILAGPASMPWKLIHLLSYLTSRSNFTGIITLSLLAGAALAQEPLWGLPVPAFQDHGAAMGTDTQDSRRFRSPHRLSLGSQTQFPPETLPPLLDKSTCHGLHYSKVPAIFHNSGARPDKPNQGRIPASPEKWRS